MFNRGKFDAKRRVEIQAVRRYAKVRLHPTVNHVLAYGASEFRDRYPRSKIDKYDFFESALVFFDEQGLVRKVEARINAPPFMKPEHLKMARADGGTPIWLPGVDLEELNIDIWEQVSPSLIDGVIEWLYHFESTNPARGVNGGRDG